LASGTKYYYRPYAKNDGGNQIGYLGASDFQTTTLVGLTLPAIPLTSINYAGGFINIGVTGDQIVVSNNGNEPISGYGYCFNNATSALAFASLSIPDFQMNAGNTAATSAPPSFVVSIPATLPTGADKIYYKIRVYMLNAGGHAYSKTITMGLDSAGIFGSVTILAI
jgi:hypothetical protein